MLNEEDKKEIQETVRQEVKNILGLVFNELNNDMPDTMLQEMSRRELANKIQGYFGRAFRGK